ncbi:MAG: hypothetical protein J7K66_03830 [Anaerolineaceae bacterium]|nr:hypothetical protein [Anaerolineaceae bacterium]
MRPLSEPTQPFFELPKLAWQPLQRVDMNGLRDTALPTCRLFIPERLREIDLGVLLNEWEPWKR